MFQDPAHEVVFFYLAGMLFILLLISTIIVYIFLHQKKVNAFRLRLQQEQMAQQQAVYAALQEGEEKERQRLAEELHDGISAKLSGLNMNIDYLRTAITDAPSKALVNRTFEGINDAINELRVISHNLHPAVFSYKTLEEVICDYIEQLNSKHKCRYQLFFEADTNNISNPLKQHCYRIITVLLDNIHKHAGAREASVQVSREQDKLQLIVEDNGTGFDNSIRSKGIGLENMRNRVSFNKGTLNIDSSGKGTTVIIELPI